MWLRSEKRSSRIVQPNTKSAINLRKIIKNTPALKNLKQTTTDVTPNRRYGTGSICAATTTAKTGKALRKNGSAKQSPANKCNIKGSAGVKRLIKKSRASVGKRPDKKKFITIAKSAHDKKKFVSVAARGTAGDRQDRVRLPRKSLRTISDVGKENRWRDQERLNPLLVVDKRRSKLRKTVTDHHGAVAPAADAAPNALARVDTCSDFAFANDSCDSCKPSTACSCSSSSHQTDDVQSNSELDAPKTDCVNYIECDSTTDNDRTNAPSTSMLINPVGSLCVFFCSCINIVTHWHASCQFAQTVD